MTMPATLSPHLTTILLLVLSNVFMTLAWYGHLKFKSRALWLVILASWSIAFFEYLPAGSGQPLGARRLQRRPAQDAAGGDHAGGLRRILGRYLGEPIRWNHLAGFALIVAASFLIFADI